MAPNQQFTIAIGAITNAATTGFVNLSTRCNEGIKVKFTST